MGGGGVAGGRREGGKVGAGVALEPTQCSG